MTGDYNVTTMIFRKFFPIYENICCKQCAIRLSRFDCSLMQVGNLEPSAQFLERGKLE